MLNFRVDVDYPYPSRRWKSFASVFLGRTWGKGYLDNAKTLAKMFNDSKRELQVYWSFTYAAKPNQEMAELLSGDKHIVALHLVKNPQKELNIIEKAMGDAITISYFTVHGIKTRGKLIWKTLLRRNTTPPPELGLTRLPETNLFNLDSFCYQEPDISKATKRLRHEIQGGKTIHLHPEWLFQNGTVNKRGRYFEVLKNILEEKN